MNNFISIKDDLLRKKLTPREFYAKDSKQYKFDWIVNCDQKSVLKLRNSDNVLKYMNTTDKITFENHNEFIKEYLSLKRIDFMIISTDLEILVGCVNLVLTNHGWEIGKYIGNLQFHGKGIAKRATISLIEFFQFYFPCVKCIFAKTKVYNNSNIYINRSIGFIDYKNLSNDFILMKKFL